MWYDMGNIRKQEYSYQKFSDEIDELLQAVIETGKGIELNTAGIKYGLAFCSSASGCTEKIPGTGRRDHNCRVRCPSAGTCRL